jgi:hypothetical protein
VAQTCETPPGQAGLADLSLLGGADNREITITTPKKQASRSAADRARLQLLARRLHRLGEAPVFYFLEEIERGAPLRETLEIYAALDADFIKAFGGDQFAQPFVITGGHAP